MMLPSMRDFDLFDDMFRDPFFKGENKIMKTDIKEDNTISNILIKNIDIDLPGFDKEDIKIDIENGYLNVSAKKESNNCEKEDGRYVRRERYLGECSRSFYVGDSLNEEDIKATFKNGTLSLVVPKEDKKKIEEKKYIQIEG